ncbi:MAG: helical backbone metal receptor [Pseudomonadota bacterium]|nr:helical backbone metal receptor [Pseudomonadota bacterium]
MTTRWMKRCQTVVGNCRLTPALARCVGAVLLGVLLGIASPAVWAQAQPSNAITLRDDRGSELTLAAPPQRIVSLLPSLTESLCALGGCDRLVGTDRYSNWPERVKALPKLGGIEDANLERIVALKPDVVLAAPSARMVERLESLGLKVLVLESKTHADVQRSLLLLSALLGTPASAAPVWDAIQRDVERAVARVPAALRGQRVYFEVDATPYAAGEGSFIGETLARLGLANVVPAALGPFPKLNPEFVVRARPDLVMADKRTLDEMPRRPGWARLDALRNDRSCGFSNDRYELLVRPGPRLGEAALQLADCLVTLRRRQP